MSVTFHCDGDGCGASAPPGTVTGGMPPQWTVKFVYEEDGTSKRCVRRAHFCGTCRRRADRNEAPAPRPKEPARKKPKRGARKKKPPESDDDQGALF